LIDVGQCLVRGGTGHCPTSRVRRSGACQAPNVMEPDREQADLPAEQPPPGQDPRFPSADADQGWPRHPGGPSAQGPRRTVGLSRPGPVLPAAHRLTRAADFAVVTKRGRRVRSGVVVVYLLAEPPDGPSRVGLVVGKAVGTSVVRHQVSRRLRAQLHERLDRIPAGARMVVRALPETATAGSAALGRDLSRALDKLTLTAAGASRRPGR
jgi:ribonuclease P protein component